MMFFNISKKKVFVLFLVIGILLVGAAVTQLKMYKENFGANKSTSQGSDNDETSQDKKRNFS